MENLFKLNIRNENITETEDKYEKYEKIILEAYYHININKGRDFRNTIVQIYNYWLKLDKPSIKLVTDFSQWIHTVTLLVDDIQDSSDLRRGIPAAHVIYGVGRTIVATDFSRYKFFFNGISNHPTEFVMIALNCIQKSLEGLTMEIYWRDNFICPSEEEYFDMISKNYGHILLSVTTYMQLYSKIKVNHNKLTILLGMYLQIADDYRGLKSQLIILEAYYHVNINKGRDFRNTVVQIYNYWLKLDKPAIKLVTDFTQWIHTAILLIDDIQDSSDLRRGIPAAHVIYGVGRTIIAADFSRYKFFYNGISNQPTEFVMIALNCIQKSLEGQTMEIYWRDNFICPSEEDYFDMISKKTGHLFLSITTYMQLHSKTKVNLNKLTILLGMYLQIADDYRGLKSPLYFQSKGFCDDIREGKFIFPVIRAIKSRPKDTRILDILKMRTTDIDLQKKCLELLEDFGSMEYTRNKLNYFKNLIIQEMKQFGFNESFKRIFENQNYDQ